MFLQPFLAYQFNPTVTLTVLPETTGNWKDDTQKWTVSINVLVAKLSSFAILEDSSSFSYHAADEAPMKLNPLRIAATFSVLLALGGFAPASAFAQGTQGWQVDVAPLYFWAANTSGNLAINGNRNIPVYMSFADAKSKIAGAFALHGEAKNGRWGILGDVNFIRLSSDVSYTTPIIGAPIAGTLKLDQVIFSGKATYEVARGFMLVGGIRTWSMSPSAHFTGPVGGQLADINVSKTEAAGVVGVAYRPKLGKKVTLLTQADVGGGSAVTWSATAGIEFLIKPWIGLAAGYNVLGIDTGNVPQSGNAAISDVQFSVKQYGPAFSLTFHWAQK